MQGQRAPRLLIVDDNDDTAHVLLWGLQQLGYDVQIAHDGAIAIALAHQFAPDVAVLDIGLPVMDGWELARRLRAQRTDLHVIALTGRTDDGDRERSLAAGFSEHLTKPVDLDVIHAAVQRLTTGKPKE